MLHILCHRLVWNGIENRSVEYPCPATCHDPEPFFRRGQVQAYSTTCQPPEPFQNKGRLIPNHMLTPKAFSEEDRGMPIPSSPHASPKALSGDRSKAMPSPPSLFSEWDKCRPIPNRMPAPKATFRVQERVHTQPHASPRAFSK